MASKMKERIKVNSRGVPAVPETPSLQRAANFEGTFGYHPYVDSQLVAFVTKFNMYIYYLSSKICVCMMRKGREKKRITTVTLN